MNIYIYTVSISRSSSVNIRYVTSNLNFSNNIVYPDNGQRAGNSRYLNAPQFYLFLILAIFRLSTV